MILSRSEAIQKMNELGAAAEPFIFFTDFLGETAYVKPLAQISKHEISYDFGNQESTLNQTKFTFQKSPLSFDQFKVAYDKVTYEIDIGNSFLVNLTFKSPISTDLPLQEIFTISKAKYKLRYKDLFVVFSPETFVKIKDGVIYSYPMKGTIDAAEENAETRILNDPKELAEHVTIVDLIRNDLSQIAKNVSVARFRFISEVHTHEKKLLQVSSEIRGDLPGDFQRDLGTMLFKLLPAGSISGAPKPETIKIIREAESYQRGFYTGICGLFDGKDLDSGVMIRFIEKDGNQLYYKSGGGITSFSIAEKEYREIIDKIYIPIA